MNIANFVNIHRSPSPLERNLAQVLRELLSGVSWVKRFRVELAPAVGGGFDLVATGLVAGEKLVFCVACKSINFTPIELPSLFDKSCPAGKGARSASVLAMPRVSARLAELCQANGWSWYDLAGNCRLEIEGLLLIEHSGNDPVKVESRSGANLGTPEASRVVRALLAPENAGRRWTQREIAAHFAELAPRVPAPSLALVNKVVRHLREQAFLEPFPNRGFRVRDFEGLLDAWRMAYRFARHQRRSYFTLLSGHALHEKLYALDPQGKGRLAFAAFSAAELQAPAVRQPRLWLYLDPGIEHEFQSAVEAKPVDSGENLVVLIPDDPGVFYRVETRGNGIPCTNPVQTFVDLMSLKGRGEEAAEAIRRERLLPAWSRVTHESRTAK